MRRPLHPLQDGRLTVLGLFLFLKLDSLVNIRSHTDSREAQKVIFIRVWKQALNKQNKNLFLQQLFCCCWKLGPNNEAQNIKGTGTLFLPPPPLLRPPPRPSEAVRLQWCLNRSLKGKWRQCVYCVCTRKWNNQIQMWVFDVCLYDSFFFVCVSSEGEKKIFIYFLEKNESWTVV